MTIAIIIAICIVVGLVAFGRIPERYYPYLLYGIALSLLWSVTLQSSYLIGTDIHLEYYYVHLAQTQGWDHSLACTYNGSLPLVLFAPALANLLGIDSLWILKVVFPAVCALVPVVAYFLFKIHFEATESFLAAFFLVSIPSFFMEVVAKQQFAEVAFVVCIYAIVARRHWAWAIGASLATVLAHYTMGGLLIIYLAGGLVLVGVFQAVDKAQYKALIIVASVMVVTSFLYYSWVCSGILMHILAYQLGQFSPMSLSFLTCLAPEATGLVLPTTSGQETLVQTALGMDFLSASGQGKAFRLFQYATQILIVVGFVYMIWKRKALNINAAYLAFATVSIGLLGVIIVVPELTSIISAPRMYHLSLLVLAPAVIIGGKLILRNIKVLALCILIPYFMFTSGLVFEVAKAEVTGVDIPYSVALSDYRLDLGASLEHDDEVVRDWIVDNDKFPIYADWYGLLFLKERCGIAVDTVLQIPLDWEIPEGYHLSLVDPVLQLPSHLEIPKGSYVFLRGRNVREQSVVLWNGVGVRERFEIDTEELTPCFSSGDAGLYQQQASINGDVVLRWLE